MESFLKHVIKKLTNLSPSKNSNKQMHNNRIKKSYLDKSKYSKCSIIKISLNSNKPSEKKQESILSANMSRKICQKFQNKDRFIPTTSNSTLNKYSKASPTCTASMSYIEMSNLKMYSLENKGQLKFVTLDSQELYPPTES